MQKLLFLCFIANLAFGNSFANGNKTANDLLNHFKSNMEATITTPIANGGILSSVDGSSSGSASITCNKKSVEFLNISYTGSDGINISVSMDKNADGIKESNYFFNGINNICSNGFAKCSNVSSKNDSCQFYAWENTGNTLNAREIQKEEALSCYCISTACGSLAQIAKERILKDIGGGLISVLAAGSSKFVVGGSVLKNNSLIYYGSSAEGCENLGEMPRVNKDSSLTNASAELASEQSTNENSVYSVFEKGTDNNAPLDKTVESALKTSTNHIRNSLSYNKSGVGYDFSYKTDSGKRINASYQNQNTNEILYCEVEYSEVSPALFSDNTARGKVTNSNSVIKTTIKECKNNICPLENGERQKHACGKIDDFAETLGILSGIESAINDMACAR